MMSPVRVQAIPCGPRPGPTPVQASREERSPLCRRECWFFLMASAFDAFMTWLLLTHESGSFRESNPLAEYFLSRFGFPGMLVFKTLLVTLVMVNYTIISRKRADVGKRLMNFGTVVVNSVVLYSVFLLYRHAG